MLWETGQRRKRRLTMSYGMRKCNATESGASERMNKCYRQTFSILALFPIVAKWRPDSFNAHIKRSYKCVEGGFCDCSIHSLQRTTVQLSYGSGQCPRTIPFRKSRDKLTELIASCGMCWSPPTKFLY